MTNPREPVLSVKLSSNRLKSLLLLSTDRFLMSEYLTLSGPGAVSLLSLESASVNFSYVIRSSFELVSVRVLSVKLFPDCFPFIQIVLIALLDEALE